MFFFLKSRAKLKKPIFNALILIKVYLKQNALETCLLIVTNTEVCHNFCFTALKKCNYPMEQWCEIYPYMFTIMHL